LTRINAVIKCDKRIMISRNYARTFGLDNISTSILV